MDQFKLHQSRRLNFKIHGNQKPKNEGKKSVKMSPFILQFKLLHKYIILKCILKQLLTLLCFNGKGLI